MDRRRFSLISHGQMPFWNPLPADDLVRILHELPLAAGAAVLDYGCGEGEVSRVLAARHGAQITGIDPNPDAIERCRRKLPGTFIAEAFRAERFAPCAFDLIVNIGASPGMPQLLEEVTPLLRPSGYLLVGDIYWREPPSAEYLEFLGDRTAPTPSLDEQRRTLEQHGFHVEHVSSADVAAWDRYEDQYDANMAAYLERHPHDPDFADFDQRRRAWRAMYLAHGRRCLGFVLFQARRGE